MVHSLDDPPATSPPTETAVIVHVRAADPVVDAHRQQLDRAAPWGVPAHVTVLYPFVLPGALDEDALGALAAAVRSVPAFDCVFTTTGWFGTDVVWLRPDPGEPFRRLTRAVWDAFPGHPPYGGAHADPVPHLTLGEREVAEGRGWGIEALRSAEATVRTALPVGQRVDHALLVAGRPAARSWRTVRALPLG